MLKILYFASLREAIGISSEKLASNNIGNVARLIAQLREQHPHAAQALSDPALRVAVNQQLADFEHPLADNDEVALFPPVTGG